MLWTFFEVGKLDLLARVQTFLLHEIKRPKDAILVYLYPPQPPLVAAKMSIFYKKWKASPAFLFFCNLLL
jgi:hypothetical protein